jgi:bacillithiol biosynthesis cysteine-adding enzyme BshC
MHFSSSYHSYKSTGLFSKLVTDYIAGDEKIEKYFSYNADNEGIAKSIENRKSYKNNRGLLVEGLQEMYSSVSISDKVSRNIHSLLSENTFTVCTAHQPNIFTGHLYFIYKIVHAIKLADDLNEKYPDLHFVPVYFMGSEDADLEELGEVVVDGKKYNWQTDQKGAVGRMKIDAQFVALIDELDQQLAGRKYSEEIISKIRETYTINKNIDKSTFEFVNQLFGKYGLVVFIPDHPRYKNECKSIFKQELEQQFSSKILADTLKDFPAEYKIQTKGRYINLFYLQENSRERIEKTETGFSVANTNLSFTKDAILNELDQFPERFSPNVILRPLVQELLLPNVAFIGGGGELAYWLELKKIFEVASVHYPVLILRNSFMMIDAKAMSEIQKLSLQPEDFFLSLLDISNKYIKITTSHQLQLVEEKTKMLALYDQVAKVVGNTDITLAEHASALKTKAINLLNELEKKQMRAGRRKAADAIHKIEKIKNTLFPGGVLQERVENVLAFYATYGENFIENIYLHSKPIEQQFCLLGIPE